ncbi:MAG TPA: VWA domain-containing protein [Terriglobia bacterium]|nr:VWA domain-containing protein [Terriglobia bacterium]
MKSLIVAIALMTASAVLLAKQSERPDEASPLRVDVRLVNIYATVIDTSGRYVDGLKKTDFIIEEDGRRQALSHFEHNQDTPVSVGVILDTSGSMIAKLDTATDAIDRFIRTIHPDDDIFLMGFDTGTYLLQDFTSDRNKLRKALKYADSGGGTALYDALQEGIRKVKRGNNTKRAILLITDGEDTTSESTFAQARQAVRESELLVYSLGISPGADAAPINGRGGRLRSRDSVDMNVLKSFATDSGGRAYLVSENMLGGKNSEFDRILAQIAAELRSQYTLAYYPAHPDDGKFHDIRVHTRYGYYVRARRGYVAGKF